MSANDLHSAATGHTAWPIFIVISHHQGLCILFPSAVHFIENTVQASFKWEPLFLCRLVRDYQKGHKGLFMSTWRRSGEFPAGTQLWTSGSVSCCRYHVNVNTWLYIHAFYMKKLILQPVECVIYLIKIYLFCTYSFILVCYCSILYVQINVVMQKFIYPLLFKYPCIYFEHDFFSAGQNLFKKFGLYFFLYLCVYPHTHCLCIACVQNDRYTVGGSEMFDTLTDLVEYYKRKGIEEMSGNWVHFKQVNCAFSCIQVMCIKLISHLVLCHRFNKVNAGEPWKEIFEDYFERREKRRPQIGNITHVFELVLIWPGWWWWCCALRSLACLGLSSLL